jgi:RNA-binding protein YhbY
VVEKEKSRAVPWAAARDEGLKVALRREKKPREPTRAETELETHELHRLRQLARGIGRWARAKKAGVTDEVVKEVRREWASGEELAAVRIVEPLRRSMDRAREILEVSNTMRLFLLVSRVLRMSPDPCLTIHYLISGGVCFRF